METIPPPRSLKHPDALLSTWFGVGRAPVAQGTWGSLVTLPPAFLIAESAGAPSLLIAAAVLFAIGVWASGTYSRATGNPDPKEVVIDEVAAQLLPLTLAPPSLLGWAAAFALFRFFDILKPWPCSYIDRTFHGGIGVMADDMMAGVYATGCMAALGAMGVWQ